MESEHIRCSASWRMTERPGIGEMKPRFSLLAGQATWDVSPDLSVSSLLQVRIELDHLSASISPDFL